MDRQIAKQHACLLARGVRTRHASSVVAWMIAAVARSSPGVQQAAG